jgi:hypothetical protein
MGVVLFVRFSDLPFVSPGLPLEGLAIAALLSVLASIGQVLVAGIGGALGAVLAAEREPTGRDDAGATTGEPTDRRDARPWAVIVGSLVAGVVTFLAVAVALTAVLDPLIWPSALVGLPVGLIVGAAVAVLGYRYLTRPPDSTVDWRAIGVGVVAVAVVFALVVGGLSVLGQQRVEQTTQHTYEYQVTLSADRTIENATFYVPVPRANGESELGERFVRDIEYDRDVVSLRGDESEPTPVNFTSDVVETAHGRMLAISADRIEVSRVYYREVENETMGWRERIAPDEYDPTDPTMGVLHDGSFQFRVTVVADEPIETAEPFGTEPLLEPQYNRTTVECTVRVSETHRCYDYDGRMYAAYETDANTTVFVSTELTGQNEWFAGGWTGNEYRQWSRTELRGPGTGWYRAEGELEVGSGRYRE